ncbi:MAG: hypothetical protein NTZ80_00295 [Patescibacteria group bacterium]|nr:hypothetical protein [Patescibacteria group bacterium]
MSSVNKVCRQNPSHQFVVTDEDQAFYEKIGVSHPTLCPDCRHQRRLVFRNERSLYHRKCDLCQKEIISIYSSDKKLPVYCPECWWSDKWDQRQYACDFDFNRPFFPQFDELQNKTPILSMVNNRPENSQYCNQTTAMKNCYLCVNALNGEDCYYTKGTTNTRNIVDCLRVFDCELCYECIDCHNCYSCRYTQNCKTCTNCDFDSDCIGCTDCFGCVGLRNKQYYIGNKQYSKDEYQKISDQLWQDNTPGIISIKFQEMTANMPRKYAMILNSENCTGDSIADSKNSLDCYDVASAENVRYCYDILPPSTTHDCYDISTFGRGMDHCYEAVSTGISASNSLFVSNCWENIDNLLYTSSCVHNCSNLFGCANLRHSQYNIFNKQYTADGYKQLKIKIIEHMKKTGEWGEFFPMSLSLFAYNEALAQEFFSIDKEEALKSGAKWKDEDIINRYDGPKINIPDRISDVSDDILKNILICDICDKNYRIISQELKFYRQVNVPAPRDCPNCRHKARLAKRNPRHLWDRTCMKCGVGVKTTYAPERSEIVYCEDCYNKSIY